MYEVLCKTNKWKLYILRVEIGGVEKYYAKINKLGVWMIKMKKSSCLFQ